MLKVTYRRLLQDFRVLPLILMAAGGLSLVDILEQAVIGHTLSFTTPLEIVLDGYRRITAIIGAIVEPQVARVLSAINAYFQWRLDLNVGWRSVFVLGAVVSFAAIRTQGGDPNMPRHFHIYSGAFMAVGALLGALIAGLLPPSGGWWAQGLMGAAPVMLVIASMWPVSLLLPAAPDETHLQSFAIWMRVVLLTGALAFGIGVLVWLLSHWPGSGLLGLSAILIAFALIMFGSGIAQEDEQSFSFGLVVLGGYAAAVLVLIADFVARLILSFQS